MPRMMSRKAARRLSVAVVVGAGAMSSAASAAMYTYTGSSGTDTFGSGSNWLPGAPQSSLSTILLYSGTLASATNVTSSNDAGTFQLNRLDFTYTGPASGTAPIVSITGGTLQFVTNGAITPQLNVNSQGTIKPSLVIGSAITFTNDTAISNSTAVTLAGLLGGSGAITKSGAGTLTLNAVTTTGSSYAGSLSITEGTVALNFAALVPSSSNILGSGTTLSIGSLFPSTTAVLTASGRNTANVVNSQTFASTQFLTGRSQIAVNRGILGNTITASLGTLSRQTAALANFTVNASSAIISTTGASNTNGIMGGWATYTDTTGSTWAALDGSGNVTGYTAFTVPTGLTPTIASGSSTNVQLTSSGTGTFNGLTVTNGSAVVSVADASIYSVGDAVSSASGTASDGSVVLAIVPGSVVTGVNTTTNQITLSSAVTRTSTVAGTTGVLSSVSVAHAATLASAVTDVNTLMVNDTASRSIDLTGKTLRLGTTGSIWRNTSSTVTNVLVMSGGTITAGGPTTDTAGELIFRIDGPVSNLLSINAAQLFSNVSSTITNNGAGAVTLVKTGTQALTLGVDNSYTGNTYIYGATLQAATTGGFGSGAVYVTDGAQAMASAAGTYANNFIIQGSGPSTPFSTISANMGAVRLGAGTTISGSIELKGDSRITGVPTANNNTTISAGGTVTGRIFGNGSLSFGTLGQMYSNVTLTNTLNSWAGDTTIALGGNSSGAQFSVLNLGASEVIPNGVGKGNLVFAYANSQTTSLQLNGFNETINALVGTGYSLVDTARQIRNNSNTAATLTMGDANASGSFFGLIQNTSGSTTGALSLRKIGSGTQTLQGRGTYTGATRIEGGVLEVDYSTDAGSTAGDNLASTSALQLAGGTFRMLGKTAASDFSESLSYGNTTSLTFTGSTAGLRPGQTISAAGFAAGTFIRFINGQVVTLSATSTGRSTASVGTVNFGAKAAGASQTFASLDLSANSTIDLGPVDGITLTFGSVTQSVDNTVLTIANWNGTVATGGGTDRILFTGNTGDFTALFSQNEVQFLGYSQGYTATQYGSVYEIAPTSVPEPGVSLLAAGAVGLLLRRRRR